MRSLGNCIPSVPFSLELAVQTQSCQGMQPGTSGLSLILSTEFVLFFCCAVCLLYAVCTSTASLSKLFYHFLVFRPHPSAIYQAGSAQLAAAATTRARDLCVSPPIVITCRLPLKIQQPVFVGEIILLFLLGRPMIFYPTFAVAGSLFVLVLLHTVLRLRQRAGMRSRSGRGLVMTRGGGDSAVRHHFRY
ncbi:hypothetical protein QBC47DRAFT_115751 [Echria macrotheca]|uniref:Transmembrane protein n=1 Tax=Echria macrotheca TaxID=438768 RepID=A0AAJ0FA55_9PEZI|nr:hypothetical protein QBC47DRAFT_115751 [Echria macrotheca]